jgi:hypothetical protein
MFSSTTPTIAGILASCLCDGCSVYPFNHFSVSPLAKVLTEAGLSKFIQTLVTEQQMTLDQFSAVKEADEDEMCNVLRASVFEKPKLVALWKKFRQQAPSGRLLLHN